MPSDPKVPSWLVSCIIYDHEGNADHFTEVVTEPGLNRRQAIAAALVHLPGQPEDPRIQRMIAWHLETSRTVSITGARIQTVAVLLTEETSDAE